jgi:hypothetical protein
MNFTYRTALVQLNRRVHIDRIATTSLGSAGKEDLAVSRLGTLAAARVKDPDAGQEYIFVSMYAFWEGPHTSTASSWIFADASVHRVLSDLSALIGREQGHRILAAGDLNILHGYGEYGNRYWYGRYKTIFDRFQILGLQFVGPQFPDGRRADPWPDELPRDSLNVPTFHHSRQTPASATRQLDFVLASTGIAPVNQDVCPQ